MCLVNVGKPPCRFSGSFYSTGAVLSFPQLPPIQCCSSMGIFDLASCVAHGGQAFCEVYSLKCLCAAVDTSRICEDRHLVDSVPLRTQIPPCPQVGCSISLRPLQQSSAFEGERNFRLSSKGTGRPASLPSRHPYQRHEEVSLGV